MAFSTNSSASKTSHTDSIQIHFRDRPIFEHVTPQVQTIDGTAPWTMADFSHPFRFTVPVPKRGRFPQDHPVNKLELHAKTVGEDALVLMVDCITATPLPGRGGVQISLGSITDMARFQASYLHKNWWCRPAFGTDLRHLPPRTQLILWEDMRGGFFALCPLIDLDFKAELMPGQNGPVVSVDSLDSGRRRLKGAAFALAFGDDPFAAISKAIRVGVTHTSSSGRLRQEKPYPPMFEYLGWCTWDAFYHELSEDGIKAKLKEFADKKVPIRWILVDDGWFSLDDEGMLCFEPDKSKFPHGFAKFIESIKSTYNIPWVGLWHAFSIHWKGISPNGALARTYREQLLATKEGPLIPHPNSSHGFALWHDFHEWLKDQGFDFVKVDGQNALPIMSRDLLPVGQAAKGAHEGFSASAGIHFQDAVINCMCMGIDASFNWSTTNIARSSDDFVPGDVKSVDEHILQNLYNALWYGDLAWCDFDMWYTDHPTGHLHAILRAISGGPIYFSDKVGETNFDTLRPLVLSDGRVLRCDAPPRVAKENLFQSPVDHPQVLVATNTCTINTSAIHGTYRSALVATFNVFRQRTSLQYEVYPHHVVELDTSDGQVAIFDPTRSWRTVLDKDAPLKGRLEYQDAHLYVLVPITEGFAPIGLKDKYVAPRTITNVMRMPSGWAVDVCDAGTFLAFTKHRPAQVFQSRESIDFTWTDGWLEAHVPAAGTIFIVEASK